MVKRRINGKVVQSYDNKLLIEILEDDYFNTDYDGAEVIIEGEYYENPDM